MHAASIRVRIVTKGCNILPAIADPDQERILTSILQRPSMRPNLLPTVQIIEKQAKIILQDENLPRFKEGALKRAAESDIHEILPKYESYYEEILHPQKV